MRDADPALRREEAGAFLRSRRERLAPADVGLPNGVRRRTPGLRREEVAMLAGVGTTWYTWLEQGRDVHPSDEVLAAIADALRLDTTERRHLHLLHGRPLPDRAPAGPEQVGKPLRRMLDSLTGQPAYVLGRRWDVLAWNEAAEAVFGPYARLEGDQRNALHLLFVDADHRRMIVEWETIARPTLAMFRADAARSAGDPDYERLVGTLLQLSPAFARWWPEREVAQPLAGRKRIDHPAVGRMAFEFSSFGVDAAPGMKLIVYTPLGQDTLGKLRGLLQGKRGFAGPPDPC